MYLATRAASTLCPSICSPLNSFTSVSASTVPFLRVKSQNFSRNPRLTVSVLPIVYFSSAAGLARLETFFPLPFSGLGSIPNGQRASQ